MRKYLSVCLVQTPLTNTVVFNLTFTLFLAGDSQDIILIIPGTCSAENVTGAPTPSDANTFSEYLHNVHRKLPSTTVCENRKNLNQRM